MATVPITAGADDYHSQGPSSFFPSNTSLRIGQQSGFNFTSGCLFRSVTIPAGATITSAIVRFVGAVTGTRNGNDLISFEDADNPAAATTLADLSGRTRTTAGTTWVTASPTLGVAIDTPDITAALQEVIDRPGWVSGNNLHVIIDRVTGNNEVQLASWDHATYDPPELIVEYDTDGYVEFLLDNFGSLDTADYTAFAGMTGDLDLRADRTGFDVAASNDVLVSRWRTAATEKKCWFFGIAFASRLKFWRSDDGTTNGDTGIGAVEQVATADVPGGGARIQVRVTYNASTGDATFYTRTDTSLALTNNTGWSQLGAAVSGSADAVFAGDSTVYPYINAYQSATAGASGAGDWVGRLYQTCVMSGISGTVVSYSDYRTGDWSDLDTGHNDAQGNTWIANDTEATHWQYVASTGGSSTQITATFDEDLTDTPIPVALYARTFQS